MSFWNFLGGFAVFNVVCDMFSSKPKRTNAPTQQLYHDYDNEDYLTSCNRNRTGTFNADALQRQVDEKEPSGDLREV